MLRNLTNCQIYIDAVDAIGVCSVVELPEIEVDQVEHQPLGMIGTVELPARIAAMEATLTWLHQPPEFSEAMHNIRRTTQVEVRSNQATYTGEGDPVDGSYVCIVRGRPKTINLGQFEQGEGTNPETTMAIDYVLVTLDGTNLLEIDAQNTRGIRVNGSLINLIGR